MEKKKRNKKRRMKKMKLSFKDAIFLELLEGRERDQNSLVTAVAKKVFGVDRTYGNMKRRAKSAITQLANRGLLKKKVLMSGGIRWSIREPGEDTIIVSKTEPKRIDLKDLTLLRTARKNIEKAEKVLRDAFLTEITEKYGNNGVQAISEGTLEILRKQYVQAYGNQSSSLNTKDLLSVAGIGDFFHILRGNTRIFEDVFNPDQILIILAQLKDMSLFRNKIQHNSGDLTEKEMIYFNIMSEIAMDKFK